MTDTDYLIDHKTSQHDSAIALLSQCDVTVAGMTLVGAVQSVLASLDHAQAREAALELRIAQLQRENVAYAAEVRRYQEEIEAQRRVIASIQDMAPSYALLYSAAKQAHQALLERVPHSVPGGAEACQSLLEAITYAEKEPRRDYAATLDRYSRENTELFVANERLRAACQAMIDACEGNDWSEPGISDELYGAKERLRAALGGEDTE